VGHAVSADAYNPKNAVVGRSDAIGVIVFEIGQGVQMTLLPTIFQYTFPMGGCQVRLLHGIVGVT